MKEPKFYPRDHPLATIIKSCNGWMPGMIAVLKQWAGIGESVTLSFVLSLVFIAGFVTEIPSLMYVSKLTGVSR